MTPVKTEQPDFRVMFQRILYAMNEYASLRFCVAYTGYSPGYALASQHDALAEAEETFREALDAYIVARLESERHASK